MSFKVDNIDLKQLEEADLDALRDAVQAEIELRIKGPKKRVWYASLNGGRQYFKDFNKAVAEMIDDLQSLMEDEDVTLRFDNSDIPEADYKLKPDSWYIG